MGAYLEDFSQHVEAARRAATWLDEDASVPLGLARQVVAESTWWLNHPSGRKVHAPGHARNITTCNRGYCIWFGANVFLVGLAIRQCRRSLDYAYTELRQGLSVHRSALHGKLKYKITSAVADSDLNTYFNYPITGGFMVFGSTGILVSQVASVLIRAAGLNTFARD